MFIPTIQEIKKVIREDIKKRITFMDKLIELIKKFIGVPETSSE